MSANSKSTHGAFRVRSGQLELERGIERHRIVGFLTRRQYGKTTEAARISLKKMMRTPGHTVIFGSVKLDLGREITRKEGEQMHRAFQLLADQAAAARANLDVVDTQGSETSKTKSVIDVDIDNWTELYEQSRLEFRLYHSNSIYSRTKVVALTPEAVGDTGDLITDEVGRVKKYREVCEAIGPIISSNPDFRWLLTTTPPPDDTHFSFEQLAPPLDFNPAINPSGNWYKSELGIWVLRVTADDAAADGVPLYDDDTGAEITPAQSRQQSHDKDAWDRNYGVKFVIGGSSAIGLIELDTAQRRGIGQCGLFQINEDSDMDTALVFLTKVLGDKPATVGVDWASSQKEGSNPTSVTVNEKDGVNEYERAVLVWKASNPLVQRERLRRIVETINSRPSGLRCRRIGQDATGQQLFCKDVARELSALAPVENVVMSETVEVPGYDTPVTKKTLMGDRYVSRFNDNRMSAPPERYYREDHRLPKKIKGLYVCEPQPDGKHGDTFDSGKIASAMHEGSVGAFNSENISELRKSNAPAAMSMRPALPRRELLNPRRVTA
jgi:hypothetical protein